MSATIQVSHGGRIVLPAKMRQALRVVDGSRMVVTMDAGGRSLHLVPLEEALDELQARASRLLGGTGSLADALVAERKREAAAEDGFGHDRP